jgi:SAM-dependent methyltransferase
VSPGWIGDLDQSTVNHILAQLQRVRARSLEWKVRFDHEPLAVALTSMGLSHSRVPVHILDLEGDHDQVFSRYSPTIRNEIRTAIRKGVQIRSTCDEKDILAYQRIYSALAQEKNWKFIYPAEVTMALAKLSDIARFFVAEYEGSVIAGGLFVRDGNGLYYMHGVADRKYDRLYPSCALIDAGIQWGCEIGAEFVNLGNSGSNKKLAEFKSYWGAHLEANWIFTWENPLWTRVSKVKAGIRNLLHLKPPSAARGGSRRVPSGMSWSERAQLGEMEAVCYAGGSERKNLMMHGAHMVGAEKALLLAHRKESGQPVVLDFGCGTGRMVRFFGNRGCFVLGVDITPAMLDAARNYGIPQGSTLCHFDGLSIPMEDRSADIVWVCAVLKYTLFPPGTPCRHGYDQPADGNSTQVDGNPPVGKSFTPTYAEVAKEMYRVLKPGGIVVNCEMWVDAAHDVFTPGFEKAGFLTERVSVLRRYTGRLERFFELRDSVRLPPAYVLSIARLCAKLRYCMDDPRAEDSGFRDYLFIWRKPEV